MEEKIETAFNALKELDIKPTPHNVSILDGVFNVLRDVYIELTKKEGDQDGRTADSAE